MIDFPETYPLHVVRLDLVGVGPVFIAEPEATEEGGSPSGVWSWIARKRSGVIDGLEHSRGWVGRPLGGLWRWLQRRIAPDEPLLRSLRAAGHLDIDHAANLGPRDVRSCWSDYLSARARTHRRWLLVDAILSPFSLLLVPLPGPNVVGFWLAYRVVVHLFAMRGASRARGGDLTTTFRAREDLDGPVSLGDHERIARLATSLQFPDLAVALARFGPSSP